MSNAFSFFIAFTLGLYPEVHSSRPQINTHKQVDLIPLPSPFLVQLVANQLSELPKPITTDFSSTYNIDSKGL